MSLALVVSTTLSIASGEAMPPPLPIPKAFIRLNSEAMAPALRPGALLIVDPIVQPLARGDIVLALTPANQQRPLRVVGLPGDRIQMDDGHFIVNGTIVPNRGHRIPREIVGFSAYPKWNEAYVVPADSVYLGADNPLEGEDSTSLGAIKMTALQGRLLTWSQTLEQPGWNRALLANAFAPLQAALPSAVSVGFELSRLEVPADASIRLTYEVAPALMKELGELGPEPVSQAYREELCRNPFHAGGHGHLVHLCISQRKAIDGGAIPPGRLRFCQLFSSGSVGRMPARSGHHRALALGRPGNRE